MIRMIGAYNLLAFNDYQDDNLWMEDNNNIIILIIWMIGTPSVFIYTAYVSLDS